MDTCEICFLFYLKAHPNVIKKLRDLMASIQALQGCNSYFDGFAIDAPMAPGKYLDALLAYSVAFPSKNPDFYSKLSYSTKGILFDCRAALHHQFRKDVRLVKAFEDHTDSAQRQFEELRALVKGLPVGHVAIHVDFKEKPRIPLGPEEPGCWWFSSARREVTCFGAHVLGHEEGCSADAPRIVHFQLYLPVQVEQGRLKTHRPKILFRSAILAYRLRIGYV